MSERELIEFLRQRHKRMLELLRDAVGMLEAMDLRGTLLYRQMKSALDNEETRQWPDESKRD